MSATPITEDDFTTLTGLSLAIEVCSDVIDGLIDPDTARKALPTLVRLQRQELNAICKLVSEGGAA